MGVLSLQDHVPQGEPILSLEGGRLSFPTVCAPGPEPSVPQPQVARGLIPSSVPREGPVALQRLRG